MRQPQTFQFKQFTIHQDRTAMKVGTDGVLLGAWADLQNASQLLDIGTGTGLIALMAAQKNPETAIDAVEIDTDACQQALENINASPWAKQITIHNTSIFNFAPSKKYDTIICNPPFFVHSTTPPDKSRTMARHCENFSHNALLDCVLQLLNENGQFYTILPTTEAQNLIQYAQNNNLFPHRITQVIPNPGKTAIRYLIKFGTTKITPEKTELILEHTHHQPTDEYIRLTKEFYLKL